MPLNLISRCLRSIHPIGRPSTFRALLAFAILLCGAPPLALSQVATVEVTFDVTLPANTPGVDTIYVAGNFQGWNPGATPLTRDSPTHARGTVTVTKGSALEFKFTRGDWERGEKAADCAELPNRKATASEDQTINVTVANWADLCVAFYDARAEKVRIESAALGIAKEFYVYTPPGYAQSPGRRYPVLYLFRGHEKEWINKNEDSRRGGKNVIDVYEQLLAARQVGPMILVFPGISSTDNSIPGMLTNFKARHLTTATGIGTGRFHDYFVQDLMGYVDANYRTVASKAGRGVDGFSLGGFMSAKIAAQHPELFATAGAFDGTHFYADLECDQVDEVRDANTFGMTSMFDPVFGKPRDAAYAALNNGPNLVCNSTPTAMQSIRWFVQYGPVTGEPLDANFLRGEHLMEKLTAKGVENGITAVLQGGHNWATADEHMRQTLPLHWRVLGPASVVPLEATGVEKSATGSAIVHGTAAPLSEHTVEATPTLAEQFARVDTVTADALGELRFEHTGAPPFTSHFYRFRPTSGAQKQAPR